MIDCTVCKKEIRSDNMARHMRIHSKKPYKAPKKVDGKEQTVQNDKKGTNFFITFQSHVKEILKERLPRIEEIRQYIVCNETGASSHVNEHSHCVVVLEEKLSFEEFRLFWCATYELPKYDDIESCRNLRQSFKYCSKEDHLCDFAAIDADYLHIHTQSYLSSVRYSTLCNTSYPYCRLQGAQRREFECRFREWKAVQQSNSGASENAKVVLKPWQRAIINQLNCQDDRQVIWIYDSEGNSGKSFLATYLLREGKSFVVEGGSTRDLVFAYKDQPNVIFDFCRSQKEFVNYHAIEGFKNGRMFSSKYESNLRIFPSCKVLAFANFLPDWTKLSRDRWMCLDLSNDKFQLVYPD